MEVVVTSAIGGQSFSLGLMAHVTALPSSPRSLQPTLYPTPDFPSLQPPETQLGFNTSHFIVDLDGGPSRLLKLEYSSGMDDTVRIVEPNNDPNIHFQYVALSHRWGNNDSFRTTKANYAEISEKGIRVKELPRTFKEAVQLAHALGYVYLWIDSLCIIQDDEEDWKNEARRMALVFSKAVCVIEAVNGNGFDSGFVNRKASQETVGNLSTRAWVLQEQMMPPRSIRFMDGAVLWECRECDASDHAPEMMQRSSFLDESRVATHPKDIFAFFRDWRLPPRESSADQWSDSTTEDVSQDTAQYELTDPNSNKSGYYKDTETNTMVMKFGDDLPGHREHFREYLNFNGLSGGQQMTIHPDDSSEPFGTFMQTFVPLYTKRRITHDSDKLAINGITSVAQRWTHLRNTFGLWFHFLDTEICWFVDPSETPGNRPAQWLGPSWSWASTCNGVVKNDMYTVLPQGGGGYLRLKPEITTPAGTSFDMPLPFVSRKEEKYHSMEIKGNLRKASIITSQNEQGNPVYKVDINPIGRVSDDEAYEFRPDCAHEFSPECSTDVYCLHVWHLDAEYLEVAEYEDIYLVLCQVGGPRDVRLHTEEISKEELLDERTMSSLGYMEVKYGRGERRDAEEIHEDSWWWWIRLV
ncbi:HET-domain-containing protein [Paramyrothecium foliicola]|nr:HET-domain-containing protein [Paramyrothecium foliicola]